MKGTSDSIHFGFTTSFLPTIILEFKIREGGMERGKEGKREEEVYQKLEITDVLTHVPYSDFHSLDYDPVP